MKAALRGIIHPDFSFSPREIASFIIVRPNAEHGRNLEVGRKIWEAVAPAFQPRIAFIRMMAQRIHAGLQDQEPTPSHGHRERDERDHLMSLIHEVARVQGKHFQVSEAILHRSRGMDGIATSSCVGRKCRAVAPTAAEFQAFDEETSAKSPQWRMAGEAWCCTICKRSKLEILRKSNKGRWTGLIHQLHSFEIETDPRNLAHRARHQTSKTVLKAHAPYLVCQDCRHVVATAVSFGGTEHCLKAEDLTELVRAPEPNVIHEIDRDAICALVYDRADWIAATDDYWAHKNRASEHFGRMTYCMSNGWTPANARAYALDEYMRHASIDTARNVTEFDWLLAEGRRFRELE